ncbi:spermidine synthase [Streptomyces xiaopingdaonensis]|uniref:spermidine synthase n=1 Tax=Streptomyces xiaopingdaonensis TaxID=1565415 RepID=UPI0002E110D2|nr:fused MFS/spermidine synthase [Streptomyces xiaopingdaonensis]
MAKKAKGQGRARQQRAVVTARVEAGEARLEPEREHPRAWSLLLDGAPQSHVDLDEPTRLVFAYQRTFGDVLDLAAPERAPLRVLHLGGGALTLARYVAATRPRSTQQVAEADGALVRFVREELPIPPEWRIRVRHGDAREVLGKVPDSWADVVLSDVFRGARTPAHLTTVEYLAEVRRVLREDGVFAANLTDGPPGAYLRAQVATAAAVFGERCLVAPPAVLGGRRFGNGVLVASARRLPVEELGRRAARGEQPARLQHGADLAEFAGRAAPVTDARATPSPAPPEGVFA